MKEPCSLKQLAAVYAILSIQPFLCSVTSVLQPLMTPSAVKVRWEAFSCCLANMISQTQSDTWVSLEKMRLTDDAISHIQGEKSALTDPLLPPLSQKRVPLLARGKIRKARNPTMERNTWAENERRVDSSQTCLGSVSLLSIKVSRSIIHSSICQTPVGLSGAPWGASDRWSLLSLLLFFLSVYGH